MGSKFFERYDRVEHFKHLSRGKTPPDEKGRTYFVRAIFENFQNVDFWGLDPPHHLVTDSSAQSV